MTLVKWAPQSKAARELAPWDALDRLFDSFFSPLNRSAAPGVALENSAVYAPAIEVVHDQDAITLYAELPGVKKEDVEISVHDDSLTIKGTKKSETEGKEDRYQYVERRFGEFFRTFQLPATVDASKVKAELKDGVLKVSLPVAEAAKPRRIQVDVN